MKRLRGLLWLMGLVMLVITGFQVYWLKDNYSRERKGLEVRSNALFRETVRDVQDSLIRFRLHLAMMDTSARYRLNRKVNAGRITIPKPPPTTARVIRILGESAMSDSLRKAKGEGIFISVKRAPSATIDSAGLPAAFLDSLQSKNIREVMVMKDRPPGRDGISQPQKGIGNKNRVEEVSETISTDSSRIRFSQTNTILFNDESGDQFAIRMDSLVADSIPLAQLRDRVERAFIAENINVPFDLSYRKGEVTNDSVFASGFPFERIPYKLHLGNTVSFLLKRISLPIIFSVFLVGITILSFVLLYRTLLRQYRLGLMKNDLISNISHELKTPIATVGVALEALKNFNAIEDAAKTREYLDISQHEIQRLNLLVDKVLKLSVFERKEIELKKEWFDCRELVHQIINSMKLQFEKYDAKVNVLEEGENFQLEADKLHISSILYNLLDNALKYSKGNPEITVKLASRAEHLELSVSDKGIGIPAAYKSKVFDKFFRVPVGDKHDAKGYGLGLSYVAEVLKRHHGFITVESELNKGSVFTAFIPYQEKDIIDFGNGRQIRKKIKIGY